MDSRLNLKILRLTDILKGSSLSTREVKPLVIGVLTHFLDVVKTIQNTEKVKNEFPEIRKLFSHLSSQQQVLTGEASKLLAESLLWFCAAEGKGDHSSKTDIWPVNLLHKYCSLQDANVLSSCSLWDFPATQSKVIQAIKTVNSRSQPLSVKSLLLLTTCGQGMIEVKQLDDNLLQFIFEEITSHTDNLTQPSVQGLLKQLWQFSLNEKHVLSQHAKFWLRTYYPPSLEWEVLEIVETALKSSNASIPFIWNSSGLERFCESRPSSVRRLVAISYALCRQSGFHRHPVELLQFLLKRYSCTILNSFDPHLRPCALLMGVNPNVLRNQILPHHLANVFQSLVRISSSTTNRNHDIPMLIVCFPSWLALAFFHIVSESKHGPSLMSQLKILFPHSCPDFQCALMLTNLTTSNHLDSTYSGFFFTDDMSPEFMGLRLAFKIIQIQTNCQVSTMPALNLEFGKPKDFERKCAFLLKWCEANLKRSNSYIS